MTFIPKFPFPHVPKILGNESGMLKSSETLDLLEKFTFPFPWEPGTANENRQALKTAETLVVLGFEKFVPVPVLPLYYVENGSWEQPSLRKIKM